MRTLTATDTARHVGEIARTGYTIIPDVLDATAAQRILERLDELVENQQLGIPRETAARFEPRLRQLCGYSVYYGLIGHIEKHDPAELLAPGGGHAMVWDGA